MALRVWLGTKREILAQHPTRTWGGGRGGGKLRQASAASAMEILSLGVEFARKLSEEEGEGDTSANDDTVRVALLVSATALLMLLFASICACACFVGFKL